MGRQMLGHEVGNRFLKKLLLLAYIILEVLAREIRQEQAVNAGPVASHPRLRTEFESGQGTGPRSVLFCPWVRQ